MAKRQIASGISAFLGLAGFIFALAAICTNYWLLDGTDSSGLWRVCPNGVCEDLRIGSSRRYENYEMVRGFGVLTVTMGLLGTVVAILSIFMKKISASVTATLFLMAAFFGLTCVGLFTSLSSGSSYGYSFGLKWAAFPFSLLAGVLMTIVELTGE
ncbi:unnamed protein product [Clavelina lepadiformis]|uniref:Uncharacterized protein n=1 Tax=Clavelina lepadiformis TaxID=159417 RepID=A0ABP0G5K3_CLALP